MELELELDLYLSILILVIMLNIEKQLYLNKFCTSFEIYKKFQGPYILQTFPD